MPRQRRIKPRMGERLNRATFVQESLVPLANTPFYITPADPADPRDCDRYPNSPWCGGNPFTRRPVDLKPSIVRDECSVGLQVEPALGFVKLPPIQVVYRRPGCRLRENEIKPNPPPKIEQNFNLSKPTGFTEDQFVVAVFCRYRYQYQSISNEYFFAEATGQSKASLSGFYHPPQMEFAPITGARLIANFKGQVFESIATNEHWEAMYRVPSNSATKSRSGDVAFSRFYLASYSDKGYQVQSGSFNNVVTDIVMVCGNFGHVFREEANYYSAQSNSNITPSSPYNPIFGPLYNTPTTITDTDIIHWDCVVCVPLNRPILPAPPAPPRRKLPPKDPMANCCPETNDLLKLILKRIGEPTSATIFDKNLKEQGAQSSDQALSSLFEACKIAIERGEDTKKIIGIDDFPIELPESVVEPGSTGLISKIIDLVVPDKTRTIESLTDLLIWMIENDSAVLGKWEQVVEVEDNDALTQGNQRETVVLPNISETLREIFLLVAHLVKANGLMFDVQLKNMTETSNTKLLVAKAYHLIDDIQQFLDYPTKQITRDVPIQITIPKDNSDDIEDLNKFLTDSKQKIVLDDWTGEASLHDMLLDILQVMSMLRANLFVQTK